MSSETDSLSSEWPMGDNDPGSEYGPVARVDLVEGDTFMARARLDGAWLHVVRPLDGEVALVSYPAHRIDCVDWFEFEIGRVDS